MLVSLIPEAAAHTMAEVLPIQSEDPEEDKIAYTVNTIRRG